MAFTTIIVEFKFLVQTRPRYKRYGPMGPGVEESVFVKAGCVAAVAGQRCHSASSTASSDLFYPLSRDGREQRDKICARYTAARTGLQKVLCWPKCGVGFR